MTILSAVDFSEGSKNALRIAHKIAQKTGQPHQVVHFIDLDRYTPEGSFKEVYGTSPEQMKQKAIHKLKENVEEALEAPDDVESIQYRIEIDHESEGLSELQKSGDYTMIVLGATGRGRTEQFFLGSTVEEVVRLSETPVLVVPEQMDEPNFEQILVPVDFSECSRKGLSAAIAVAETYSAKLHVLHSYVLPSDGMAPIEMRPLGEQIDTYKNYKSQRLNEFVEEFQKEISVEMTSQWKTGNATNAIVETIGEKDIDLTVMGTHGYRGFKKLVMGSTTQKILRRIPSPVLTVRYTGEG